MQGGEAGGGTSPGSFRFGTSQAAAAGEEPWQTAVGRGRRRQQQLDEVVVSSSSSGKAITISYSLPAVVTGRHRALRAPSPYLQRRSVCRSCCLGLPRLVHGDGEGGGGEAPGGNVEGSGMEGAMDS